MSTKLFVALFILLLVLYVAVLGMLVVSIHKHAQPEIPIVENPIIVQPLFQRGDCFNGTKEKEAWEMVDTPDGIIERVGKQSYLILYRNEAERNINTTKVGLTMSFATFDQYHVKAVCPETWVKHTSKH